MCYKLARFKSRIQHMMLISATVAHLVLNLKRYFQRIKKVGHFYIQYFLRLLLLPVLLRYEK